MQQYRNLILGFSLIITLMVGLGVASLYHLNSLSKDVDNIYRHPFAVSNAGQAIETLIYRMHRDMKDVVLTQDVEKIRTILNQINQSEYEVHSQFDVIFERFLGDKAQIKQSYDAFNDWKNIRDEVVRLKLLGRNDDAIEMTRGSGAQHVDQLLAGVHEFVVFAHNKADEFHRQADKNKNLSIIITGWITLINLFLGIMIARSVTRHIRKANREIASREHLVDQHIMLAELDRDGRIVSISNALCRFLGKTKSELIGHASRFFDNSEDALGHEKNIWRTVKTGQAWQGEIRHISDDGLIRWANSTVLPVLNDQYEVTGYTNLLQDSTSKKQSITDKLTTLPNRRSFEEVLDRELRLCHRNNTPLALAILDVDYFKRYNDTFGHPEGDKALRQVADSVKALLRRPGDFAFRIGGEEFAILLSNQEQENVREFLEVIRSSIEALHIPHPSSETSNHLTVSIGAYWTNGTDLLDRSKLYSEADKSLYLAKHNRNQVVISNHEREYGDNYE